MKIQETLALLGNEKLEFFIWVHGDTICISVPKCLHSVGVLKTFGAYRETRKPTALCNRALLFEVRLAGYYNEFDVSICYFFCCESR